MDQRDDRRSTGDRHIPVFADRVAELFAPALAGPQPTLIDATVGLGGHSVAFLRDYSALRVIGIDRDSAALEHARSRIADAGYGERLRTVHGVYDQIGELAPAESVDAVFFDLGVSSMQLDRADRGFAYAIDAPLDMRMDSTSPMTAADVVNSYDEMQLTRILRDYGEEKFAHRIARAIVRRRAHGSIDSSALLVELIREAIPAAARRVGGHPAKRTFQALRIEVNDELGALERAMPAALSMLRVGGRIVVLSYQSLEDRLVKRAIAPLTVSTSPLDLPVELPGHEPMFSWLVRGAERPSATENDANPRARSAKLRAAVRLRSTATQQEER